MTRHLPADGTPARSVAGWSALIVLWLLLAVAAPARASLAGDLSGTVTARGAPVANVRVAVTPVDQTGARSAADKVVLTDAEGRYHLPDLYDRRVKVGALAPPFGPYVDTYWPRAHVLAQADVVEISTWPVEADIELVEAGSLAGRIVDDDTGLPVAGVRIRAYLADATATGPVGAAPPSDAAGFFSLAALPPGALRLRVGLPPDSGYLVAPAAIRPEGGIRIEAGRATTGIQVRLQRGAEIRGTVRDDVGLPVSGATIKVIGCAFACPLLATSDESGNYRIRGVRPGQRLGVVAWRDDDLLKQWYPRRDTAVAATDIDLRPGQVLDSVDFQLTRAAFLTLEVRDTGGNQPVTAIVLLRTQTGQRTQYFPGRLVRWSGQESNPTGQFQVPFGPLPPGSYDLRVNPGTANPGYLDDRWLANYGVGPDGRIRLSAGEQARAVVGLIAEAAPPAGAATLRTESDQSVAWPGLRRGFLDPIG